MRGAQPWPTGWPSVASSRSPHARGSTVAEDIDALGRYPIPACAGLNRTAARRRAASAADPRMRGAQPASPGRRSISCSRSPHARGSTGVEHVKLNSPAPIPACAGLNRSTAKQVVSTSTDPRMRGAQPGIDRYVLGDADRSPHARGSTAPRLRLRQRLRPIPACAGLNRRAPPRCSHARTDPRMRGAQPNFEGVGRLSAGRSPHARGSTGAAPHHHTDADPIPACAGLNRLRRICGRGAPPDPRMRGAQP